MSRRRRGGFTLVELLVVIGIIAVLIAVLLPALQGARRQAASIKCASQLREIGTSFAFYSHENKGYYPVAKYTGSYNIDGTQYPTAAGYAAYWQNFLAKYVTKMKVGGAATSADQAALARKTIFWGCPNWDPYFNGSINIHTGYGMNPYPSFTPTYPATGVGYPAAEMAVYTAGPPSVGAFMKQVRWTRPSERALMADCRFWLMESQPAPSSGIFPPQSTIINSATTYTPGVTGQTLVDVYRHGKYPSRHPTIADAFSQTGGKVGYNILYCDGHVAAQNDQREAYYSIRMRFPD